MIEKNKRSYCSKISKTTIRRIALIFTFDLNASQIANPFLPSPPNTVTSAPLLWTKESWDSANRKILWTVILELMKASLVIASIITIWCSGAWENPMYIYTWGKWSWKLVDSCQTCMDLLKWMCKHTFYFYLKRNTFALIIRANTYIKWCSQCSFMAPIYAWEI